jgi:hypothetical protein
MNKYNYNNNERPLLLLDPQQLPPQRVVPIPAQLPVAHNAQPISFHEHAACAGDQPDGRNPGGLENRDYEADRGEQEDEPGHPREA